MAQDPKDEAEEAVRELMKALEAGVNTPVAPSSDPDRYGPMRRTPGGWVPLLSDRLFEAKPDEHGRWVIDLAGKPLSIEDLMREKRIIEGKPDLDELTSGMFRMQADLRALPTGLKLHPQDWHRLLQAADPMGLGKDAENVQFFEWNVGNCSIKVVKDPTIPIGSWFMESDVDGLGLDALAGPVKLVNINCPHCAGPVHVWVAYEWNRPQVEPRSEEVELRERLRLKVREKYLSQREVLVEFAEWLKTIPSQDLATRPIFDAKRIDEFLEQAAKK